MTLINGKYIEGDFIGRAIYENFHSSDIKMKYFQVWGVSSISPSRESKTMLMKAINRILGQ
jgi:hypothetical protein